MLICISNVLSKADLADFRRIMDASASEELYSSRPVGAGKEERTDSAGQRGRARAPPRAVGADREPKIHLGGGPAADLSAAVQSLRGIGRTSVRCPRRQRSEGDPLTGLRIRTDLSVTLFLSEPDEYDGGELVVRTSMAPARSS
jgi:PKHD-type hydroxylase